jgi:hypothetical protein
MSKYKNLYRYHLQIVDSQNNDDVIIHLLKGRINDFYKHNGVRLNSMLDKIQAMQKEYFQFDETGKVKTEDKPIGETGETSNDPVMLEGKTYVEYLRKYNELMDTDCVINF